MFRRAPGARVLPSAGWAERLPSLCCSCGPALTSPNRWNDDVSGEERGSFKDICSPTSAEVQFNHAAGSWVQSYLDRRLDDLLFLDLFAEHGVKEKRGGAVVDQPGRLLQDL